MFPDYRDSEGLSRREGIWTKVVDKTFHLCVVRHLESRCGIAEVFLFSSSSQVFLFDDVVSGTNITTCQLKHGIGLKLGNVLC